MTWSGIAVVKKDVCASGGYNAGATVAGTFVCGAEVEPVDVIDVVGLLVGKPTTAEVVEEADGVGDVGDGGDVGVDASWVRVLTPGLARGAARALIGEITKAPMTAKAPMNVTAPMNGTERNMRRLTLAEENT